MEIRLAEIPCWKIVTLQRAAKHPHTRKHPRTCRTFCSSTPFHRYGTELPKRWFHNISYANGISRSIGRSEPWSSVLEVRQRKRAAPASEAILPLSGDLPNRDAIERPCPLASAGSRLKPFSRCGNSLSHETDLDCRTDRGRAACPSEPPSYGSRLESGSVSRVCPRNRGSSTHDG